MVWRCKDYHLELDHTLTMAIVNVTPDSFSDGGKYFALPEAVRRIRNCVREGAEIIDLGGESTRPNATPVSWQEEWRRLEPVLAAIIPTLSVPVSIDTYHPQTAEKALAAGASIINCVRRESVKAMLALAGETGCGLVIPFRLPGSNGDGAAELAALLRSAGNGDARALAQQVAIDPMIGFDTTREEDLALMGSLRHLARLAPVLVGVSRKRLIRRLTGEKSKVAGKNLGGSLGAAVWCAMAGAAVVRVHDVRETVQALRVADAFASHSPDPNPPEANV